MDGWLDKQNVCVYTYNGILYGLKKEKSDTGRNMDEPWGYYARWNNPDTKRKIVYDSTFMRYRKYSKS